MKPRLCRRGTVPSRSGPVQACALSLPEFIIKPLAEHLLRHPPLLGRKDPRVEGLIFSGERGGPIRRHVFHAVWVKACDAAGLKGVRVE